ncbi:MAG TPA: hypothetical protein DIV79_15590 [Opitutae bacterium]|nr:hypothetical protein [Opitutaceae bacterium]HCR31427.1 hypothetical protein [Opitutae bacterium]
MRVYVREPRITDAEAFVAKARESIAMHRPWVYPPTSIGGFQDYLDRLREPRYEGYFICRKTDAEIVGVANVSEINRGAMNSGFAGYWAFSGFQGHGYLTEGLALVFDDVFDRLRLHRLEVNIQPANTASIALAKRLGLRKEGFSKGYLNIGGEWRDHERWAILDEEWEARGGSLFVVS